jgi:hypothetical protein
MQRPQLPAPPQKLTSSTPSWRAQSSNDWPGGHSPRRPIGSKSTYTVTPLSTVPARAGGGFFEEHLETHGPARLDDDKVAVPVSRQ